MSKQEKPIPPKPDTWRRLTDAQAAIIVAIIGIVPSLITGLVTGYLTPRNTDTKTTMSSASNDAARKRIEAQIPDRVGYKKYAYPSLGIGFLAPASWTPEDAAALFGGGELDIVKRYEETKGIIGMKFRVRSVQRNYINDIQAEIANQRDVWVKIDPNLVIEDTVISGIPAKIWKYKQSTGRRIGDIRWYWLRLAPEVRLDVLGFIYTDSVDRNEFWGEVDRIMESLVLDQQLINEKRKNILLHSNSTM